VVETNVHHSVVEVTDLAKDDLVRCEGKISEAKGQGNYKVTLDNGAVIAAKLCGKMKRFKIRITVGDRVTVGLSPYDLSHGLITHRN
jgi:translation initiation factor IF-1